IVGAVEGERSLVGGGHCANKSLGPGEVARIHRGSNVVGTRLKGLGSSRKTTKDHQSYRSYRSYNSYDCLSQKNKPPKSPHIAPIPEPTHRLSQTHSARAPACHRPDNAQIGRASCRERV